MFPGAKRKRGWQFSDVTWPTLHPFDRGEACLRFTEDRGDHFVSLCLLRRPRLVRSVTDQHKHE